MHHAPLAPGCPILRPLCLCRRDKRPPNIVLLYSDDIGWGDLGCYGAKAIPTPNLDRLAAQGTRFTSGYCTSATCTPSRYSLLTGEYAWRRQGTGVLPGDARLIIKPGRPTMAASLAKLGYATGVVGKWHLGLGSGDVELEPRRSTRRPIRSASLTPSSWPPPATGCRRSSSRTAPSSGSTPRTRSRSVTRQPYPGDPDLKTDAERAKLKMDWSHGHNMALVNGVGRIGWMKGGKSAHLERRDDGRHVR